MTHRCLPPSRDPDVRAIVTRNVASFRARLHHKRLTGAPTPHRRTLILGEPLTGAQRDSRDAWVAKGLSAVDATMLVLEAAR